MKLVSIILPTYNGEKYLREALDSVLCQTYSNWELIIVDDCSKDATLKIATDYAKRDKRIRVLHNKKNLKISKALNKGFTKAKGDYFTWTSDDNYFSKVALEKMASWLDAHPKDAMVYANSITLDEEAHTTTNAPQDDITPDIILHHDPCGACFMYRKSAAAKVGKYDESLIYAQDYDYFLRMYLHGNISHLNENLYTYRLHKGCQTVMHKKALLRESYAVKTKYIAEYAKKFPAVKDYFAMMYLIEKLIATKDIKQAEKLAKYDAKPIYQALRNAYRWRKEPILLEVIKRLGGKYRLKALYIKIKYGLRAE